MSEMYCLLCFTLRLGNEDATANISHIMVRISQVNQNELAVMSMDNVLLTLGCDVLTAGLTATLWKGINDDIHTYYGKLK